MAQHDYVIDNSTGANVRADINNALLAISSNNSGSSAPSTTYALQTFANTTDTMLQLRNAANNAFVNLRKFDGSCPLPDGTNSAPSLFFDDDTNTGLYSSAADTLNIATGGTERLELGTTTIFNDDGEDVDFRIEGDDEQNLFYVDAGNDRIGINTSSPNSKLNIFDGSDNDVILFVQGADTTSEYVSLGIQTGKAIVRGGGSGSTNTALTFEYANAGTELEGMRLDSSGRLLIGTTSSITTDSNAHSRLQVVTTAGPNIGLARNDTDVDDDDRLGLINFASNHGGTYHEIVTIRAAADADHTAGSKPSRLELYTTQSGNTQATERMRIDSSGNVGIGTTNPTSILNISGSSSPQIKINSTNQSPAIFGGDSNRSSDGQHLVEFRGNWNGTNVARIVMQAGFDTINKDDGILVFETSNGGNLSEAIRIDELGKVGIGTSNPSQLLHLSNADPRICLTETSNNSNCFLDYSAGGILEVSVDDNNVDSASKFQVRIDGATASLTLDTTGLGIGTTSPSTKLNISQAATGAHLLVETTDNNTRAQAEFKGKESDGTDVRLRVGGDGDFGGNIFTVSNHKLGFATNNAAPQMILDTSGALLIGRTSSGNTGNGHTIRGGDSVIFSRNATGETLQVSRNSSDGDIVQFRSGNSGNASSIGEISKSGGNVVYGGTSDYRLKENEVAISDGITRIKLLKPYRFNFKSHPTRTVDGFFAHEVTPAVPEAVVGNKDDSTRMQSLDQSKIVPLLTAALQEAITKIEVLETKVATLEAA